jgi:hypothetical protein
MRELETLVRHLADELAAFRRRALTAEAKLKDGEAGATVPSADLAQRVAELERANDQLKSQLAAATTRATQMLDRVRFLRQQAQDGGAR